MSSDRAHNKLGKLIRADEIGIVEQTRARLNSSEWHVFVRELDCPDTGFISYQYLGGLVWSARFLLASIDRRADIRKKLTSGSEVHKIYPGRQEVPET